jgi:hypothetical protein
MTELFLRLTVDDLQRIEHLLSHMRHVPAYRELHDRVAATDATGIAPPPVWIASPGGAAMCAAPARTAGGTAATHGNAARGPLFTSTRTS